MTSDVVESGSSNAAEIKAGTPDSLSPTTISFIDNIFLVGSDSLSQIVTRSNRPCERDDYCYRRQRGRGRGKERCAYLLF